MNEIACEMMLDAERECGKPAIASPQGFPACAECLAACLREGVYDEEPFLKTVGELRVGEGFFAEGATRELGFFYYERYDGVVHWARLTRGGTSPFKGSDKVIRLFHEFDGLSYPHPTCGGPCTECAAEVPCMEFEGRMLCYDHWHGAREKTQCYKVQRVFQEGWPEICRGFTLDGAYTKEEAEDAAREVRANPSERAIEWIVVPWPTWEGSRRAHPGYLYNKRIEVQKVLGPRLPG